MVMGFLGLIICTNRVCAFFIGIGQHFDFGLDS